MLYIIHMAIEQVITNFQSSSEGGVLFCTDVCGMGVHVPGLAVGVSLGDHFIQGLFKCNYILRHVHISLEEHSSIWKAGQGSQPKCHLHYLGGKEE